MKVFISGSRNIEKLPKKIINILNKLIQNNDEILIGDCVGVDTAIQKYLYEKKYENVSVYTSGSVPREFHGSISWKIIKCNAIKTGMTDKEYHAIKDIRMSNICDIGIVVWNGSSTASRENFKRLKMMNKKVYLYDLSNEKLE